MVSRRLPPAHNVGEAIESSASLAALLAGHRRSNACYRHMLPALPATLRDSVRPGPIDGSQWTLFAENSAIAAKLRQLVPDLLAAVAAREPGITELRIKIRPRSS